MKNPLSAETIFNYFKVIDSCQRDNGVFPIGSQGAFVFRGESEQFPFPCHSSLSRYLHENSQLAADPNHEKYALRDWISQSEIAERRAYPINHWEQLMWARHHGLKTRLTDWTFNPLAALWFSCDSEINEPHKDGRVFMCRTKTYGLNQLHSLPTVSEREYYKIEHPDKRTEKLKSIFVLPPNNFNDRISSQAGVFHSSCDRTKSILDLGEDHIEICIPARAKKELIGSLGACNINKHTLGLSTPDNIAYSLNNCWFK